MASQLPGYRVRQRCSRNTDHIGESQVPVQNLREGAQLLSYDMTSKQFITTTLTQFATVITNNLMVIKTTSGKPLIVDQNPEQELYTMLPDGKWLLLPVTELQVGDKIFEPTKIKHCLTVRVNVVRVELD